MRAGSAWDVSVDQINQVVWACGVNDYSKPWITKSIDKGDSWETKFLELDTKDSVSYKIAIHPVHSEIIYLAVSESVIKSVDGGKTWSYTGLRGEMVRFYALAIDPFNPDHIWAAGAINENYLVSWITPFILYESFNAGGTWQFVPANLEVPEQSITSIAPDPNQKNVLYIATEMDGIWRYKSKAPSLAQYFPLRSGNWWTFSNSITDTIIDTVRIDDSLYFQFDEYRHFPNALLRMTNDNKLLLKTSTTEQLWLDFSANIGDSWKVVDADARSEWTVHLQSKSDTVNVPAGKFTNCYRFWFQFDGADNDWVEWYAPGVGPVKRILYGFAVIEYQLLSASVNEIIFPTKVAEQAEFSIPNEICLHPNYPNPFNASTMIPFDLPYSSNVTLEIYNIMGKKVRTLVADQKPAGRFKVQWYGRDDFGYLAASGIYFCKLQITKTSNDVFIQTRKLILLR